MYELTDEKSVNCCMWSLIYAMQVRLAIGIKLMLANSRLHALVLPLHELHLQQTTRTRSCAAASLT